MVKYYYILAIINPFLALLVSLREKAPESVKWTLAILFCMFFGLNFYPASEGLDSYTHYEKFLQYHKKGAEILNEHWSGLKNGVTDPELYVPVTYFLLSRVTDSIGIFFAFHALVYALFFVGSLRLLYRMRTRKLTGIGLIMFLFVVFLFPIHQINAIRWFTAMWAFVYCFMRYLNGDKHFLYLAFLPGLIHFSLYVPAVFLLLSKFIGYRPWLLLGILLLSFAVPRISSNTLVENKNIIGIQSIEKRSVSYTNEDYVELKQNSLKTLNWYVTWRYTLVHYFLVIIAGFYLFRNFRSEIDRKGKIFYSFLFVWATFVNFTFEIPSFGGRMRFLLWVLMAAFLFLRSSKIFLKENTLLNYIGLGIILLYALVDLRAYSANVSINWIIGNPILAILPVQAVTLRDVLFFWE